jgi:hypothetical protein
MNDFQSIYDHVIKELKVQKIYDQTQPVFVLSP